MGGGLDPRTATNIVKDENTIRKAAKEVMDGQIDLGIDVITDGEVERGKIQWWPLALKTSKSS